MSNINKKTGFTLTELIMVIVIISIIALVTTGIIMFFMRNTIFLPNQMNVQQAADAAMDIIIEGDDRAKGLRFATEIVALGNNMVRFIDFNGRDVRFRRRDDRLQRRIRGTGGSWGPWEIIPYYASGDLRVTRQPGGIFEFFDDGDSPTTTPADVRRIKINLLSRTGTGVFDDWEGQINLASSVKLYGFVVNQPPTVEIRHIRYSRREGWYDITFRVDDSDGGQVAWLATLTGDPGGNSTLDRTSGSGAVRYTETIRYTPTPGWTGTATITITVDDGAGGTATDSEDINV